MIPYDNSLPAGRMCQDCAHYCHCKMLFGCRSTARVCDWTPSRFVPAVPTETEVNRQAKRYRELKRRFISADFAYGSPPITAAIFEFPRDARFTPDLDVVVDAVMEIQPPAPAAAPAKPGPFGELHDQLERYAAALRYIAEQPATGPAADWWSMRARARAALGYTDPPPGPAVPT